MNLKQWFAPLGIFVGGMLTLLVMTLFFPAIDATTGNLSSNITADLASKGLSADNFTGLTWATSSGTVKWLIFFGTILLSALMAAKEFLSQR